MTRPRARWAWALLGVGLLGCVGYLGLRFPSTAEAVSYLAIGGLGLGMTVVGAALARGSRRLMWVVVAVAQALYWIGDALWTVYESILHIAPYPSVADVAYLSRYLLLAVALGWLVQTRQRGRDWAALLDAAIVCSGVVMLGGVLLVAPAAAAGQQPLLTQIVNTAYPVCDVLLLCMIVRALMTQTSRSVSFWALLLGLTVNLVGDVPYVLYTVSGTDLPFWLNECYLLTYLLIGFAALHPSASVVPEPAAPAEERLGMLRLAALGAAVGLAPAMAITLHLTIGDDFIVFVGAVGILTTVLAVLRGFALVRQMRRQAAQLSTLARSDALTGLPNRRTWDHELARACTLTRAANQPLTLGLIDLDWFKAYNDEHGHHVGDLLLKEAATTWQQLLGKRGLLARYGGEEFAVLLPGTSLQDSVALLNSMREAVPRGQTCSVGVARWDGAEQPSDALERADQALYVAKRSGRNQVSICDPATHVPTVPAQVTLTRPLRTALQPIVDLRTGEVVGHEALSRFEGMDASTAFATARHLGTGTALEEAAIRSAIAHHRLDLLLAVKVSVEAVSDADVRAALPADLSGIVLELTQTGEHEIDLDVSTAIAELRTRGALITIDHWGAGRVSLEQMLRLAPDIVKLDISLVRHVVDDARHRAAVRTLAAYAHEVGSSVCAAGVETREQRDVLRQLGVHYAQGYLFGRPEVPHDRLDPWRTQSSDMIEAGS